MGRWVTRRWENMHGTGLRRRDRRSGQYHAYVPDTLSGASLRLSADAEALAMKAEDRVRRISASPDMTAVARFLLRSEAIASSRIEGIAPSAHKVALAELGQSEEVKGLSEQARAVAHNVTAVKDATEHLAAAPTVTINGLLALHRSLLPDSPEHHGIREAQNWLGGSSYRPLEADFIPPPPELVPALLDDLMTYLNSAAHAPLIQAALVHAQFETIHPFTDGNGRMGRALIHTVLARRGLLSSAVLPTSLILATLSDRYVESLSLFRGINPVENAGRASGEEPISLDRDREAWIVFFLEASILACDQAEQIAAELADVRADWDESIQRWAARENANHPLRADSAASRILSGLPGTPVLTIQTASRIYGVSRTAASRGLETLRSAGILTTESIGVNRRAYTARSVLDTITWAERRLASTRFDTRVSIPVRAVPARPGH